MLFNHNTNIQIVNINCVPDFETKKLSNTYFLVTHIYFFNKKDP